MISETTSLDEIRSKFQVISDTHLEKMSGDIVPDIEALCPYLILAGDIGYPNQQSYWRFVEDASNKFQIVFLILGNKEFSIGPYRFVPTFVRDTIRRKRLPNVIFLDGTTFDFYIDDIRIRVIGTTLWTYCADPDPYRFRRIVYHRPDGSIGNFGEINNMVFLESCRWLEREIDRCSEDGCKAIIITHHVPSFKLLKLEYRIGWNNYMNEYYASDCEHLFREPVVAWYYGHTNDKGKQVLNDIAFYIGSSNANKDEDDF